MARGCPRRSVLRPGHCRAAFLHLEVARSESADSGAAPVHGNRVDADPRDRATRLGVNGRTKGPWTRAVRRSGGQRGQDRKDESVTG